MAHPVAGNAEGSYTTLKSNAGVVFAGCTIATGFAGVFCDQGVSALPSIACARRSARVLGWCSARLRDGRRNSPVSASLS